MPSKSAFHTFITTLRITHFEAHSAYILDFGSLGSPSAGPASAYLIFRTPASICFSGANEDIVRRRVAECRSTSVSLACACVDVTNAELSHSDRRYRSAE